MIQLSDLISAAKLQQNLEKQIESLEESLKLTKEKHRFQQTEVVPGMMQELGVNSLELEGGYKVGIKDEYYGKISEDNAYAAFEWLRANGLDGIVKTAVSVSFGKGEDQQAQDVVDWLAEQGVPAMVKSTVHPQTLKAFVKERISSGLELPMDLFGVAVIKTTVISK